MFTNEALFWFGAVIHKSPGLEPHCVVFLGRSLYSHSASLHPGVKIGTSELNAGGNPSVVDKKYFWPLSKIGSAQ